MKVSRQLVAGCCLGVWVAFLATCLWLWPGSNPAQILTVTLMVLISHVIFAGYYIITRIPRVDLVSLLMTLMVGALILAAPFLMSHYWWLALELIPIFLAAMVLHYRILRSNLSQHINHLCRYKLKLEAGIIAAILLQATLLWLMPNYQTWIAGFGLAAIVIVNGVMIGWQRIYSDSF